MKKIIKHKGLFISGFLVLMVLFSSYAHSAFGEGLETSLSASSSEASVAGTASALSGSQLMISGSVSAPAWGISGVAAHVDSATYTDTTSASFGTVANTAVNSLGIPTVSAVNSALTYTNASTLYIAGAPISGTNVSITNPLSLYVNSGRSVFAGGLSSGTSIIGSNFNATGGSAMASTTTSGLLFGGVPIVNYRAFFNGNTSSALGTSNSYANMIVGSSPVTTAAFGTHSVLANEVVNPLGTVTNTGAVITNTASLYVNGASTAGTNNYSIWAPSGLARLDGGLTVSGTTTLDSSLNGILKATSGVLSVATPGVDYQVSGGSTPSSNTQVLRVPSKYNKTANATLNTVSGLTANLEASKSYTFESTLYVTADQTGGAKFAIGGTATVKAVVYEIQEVCNDTSTITLASMQTVKNGAAGQSGCTSALVTIKGTISTNAAGTLTTAFGQNVASGVSSVLQGSTMKVEAVQ
jgi:hypothetical protein